MSAPVLPCWGDRVVLNSGSPELLVVDLVLEAPGVVVVAWRSPAGPTEAQFPATCLDRV